MARQIDLTENLLATEVFCLWCRTKEDFEAMCPERGGKEPHLKFEIDYRTKKGRVIRDDND